MTLSQRASEAVAQAGVARPHLRHSGDFRCLLMRGPQAQPSSLHSSPDG
jgi:hypothetical protein